MHTTPIANIPAALRAVVAPSSIPPAPASGVTLRGSSTPSRVSSAPSPSVSAAPCAELWLGPAAAATLHASQVMSVAVDELDWLYENTDDETDPVCVRARASIEGWLSELSPDHQAAIVLHHDPAPWPEELPGHEEDSFALVLHVLLPSDRRSLRMHTLEQLQSRARARLAIALERNGPRALTALIRSARWLYEDAVREYAKVRGRAPSVLPPASSAFASTFDEDALG